MEAKTDSLLQCQYCHRVKLNGVWIDASKASPRIKEIVLKSESHTDGKLCDKCSNKRSDNHYLW